MKLTESPRVSAELNFQPFDVKRIQEWLWLHGPKIEIDAIMGPATRAALAEFRRRHAIEAAEPDAALIEALTLPMRRALQICAIEPPVSFCDAVIRIAQMHLASSAREAPGHNRGPWVRIYGEEGQPWCANFVTFVMKQASEASGIELPIRGSAGCDELSCQARRTDRLVEGFDATRISAGDLFLSYRLIPGGHRDYHHTGFVEQIASDHLVTIEGNTNPSGGREGYEVERRFRSFDQKDFLRLL